MRQVFSSARLENVEGVARLLNEAGIETWINDGRSYKGNRRRTFSYSKSDSGGTMPGVWIVKAEDLTRARALLRDAGLIDSTRSDSYLPQQPPQRQAPTPRRIASRVRLVLLCLVVVAFLVTLGRSCNATRDTAPTDSRHIVPVDLS